MNVASTRYWFEIQILQALCFYVFVVVKKESFGPYHVYQFCGVFWILLMKTPK